jgi:hypothetical protein
MRIEDKIGWLLLVKENDGVTAGKARVLAKCTKRD